jgi:hypothetical protein
MLVPAAATCGLLWIGAVLVGGLRIHGGALVGLGAAGVLATAGLLLIFKLVELICSLSPFWRLRR